MNLMDYLPHFYASEYVKNVQDSINTENEELQLAIKDLENQLFVSTATWGLSLWEKYCGLDISESDSFENRRSRIMTKLRGQGTATKDMLKNALLGFEGGTVEIIENNNDYSFTLKFSDESVVPTTENIQKMLNIIKDIRPAHLNYDYTFKYNWWGKQDTNDTTWENGTSTWEDLKKYTEGVV